MMMTTMVVVVRQVVNKEEAQEVLQLLHENRLDVQRKKKISRI